MRKAFLSTAAVFMLAGSPLSMSTIYANDTSPTPSTGTQVATASQAEDAQQAKLYGPESDVLRPGADPNNPYDYPYLPPYMNPPIPGDRTQFPEAPTDSSSTGASSSATNSPIAGSGTLEFPDIALGKPYTIGTQWPDQLFSSIESSNFPNTGQLTDGRTASLHFSDKGWVGLLRQYGRSITVNLGSVVNVRRVSLDFLQDLGAGIDFPDSVTFYASDNGVNWYRLGTAWSTQGAGDYTPQTQVYQVDTNVNAQYIRAQFEDKVFAFVDELAVYGSTQPAQCAKPLRGFGHALTQIMGNDYLVDPDAPGLPQNSLPDLHLKKYHDDEDREHHAPSGYLMSDEPATAGIRNMQLVYTGAYGSLGTWTKSDFLPMIAQEDANGNPHGWLFDGTLFGEYSSQTPTTAAAWTAWLNDLFSPDINLSALDQAVGALKQQLKDPSFKEKVVITIPILTSSPSNFGSIDSSGQNIDLNPADVGQVTATENKVKVIQWYIQEVLQRWNKANFSNLTLVGFYWEPESLNAAQPYDAQLIQATSYFVHREHLKFFWIPYYGAPGITEWRQLGFDSVMIQPNVSFNWNIDAGARLKSTADQARYYHTGIEIEQHWDVVSTNTSLAQIAINKYFDYFTAGYLFGYENGVLKSYYLNSKTLLQAYQNPNPFYHQVYDSTVQYVNGQWTSTTFN